MSLSALPITDHCHSQLKTKNHVCFGISPFNSYFSEARIAQLAKWGKSEFKSMHFFIPDIPAIYTLEALGYDSEKATWKARRQSQYLYNKTVKALISVGIEATKIESMILTWKVLRENLNFQNLHAQVQNHFETNLEFRNACLAASAWVLEGKLPYGSVITEEQSKHAVKYLLSEIPLFLYTPCIVDVESSVFCYHQCIPFIENLMRGSFSCQKNSGQGFAVIKPSEVSESARTFAFEAVM